MAFIIRQLDINKHRISLRALFAGFDVVIKAKGKKILRTYYSTLDDGYRAFWRYCKQIKEGRL